MLVNQPGPSRTIQPIQPNSTYNYALIQRNFVNMDSSLTCRSHNVYGISNLYDEGRSTSMITDCLSNTSNSTNYSSIGLVMPEPLVENRKSMTIPNNDDVDQNKLDFYAFIILIDSKHEFPASRLAKLKSSIHEKVCSFYLKKIKCFFFFE